MPGGEKNYGKIRCPIHRSPSRDISMSTLWRRKSFDSAYLYRTDVAAQHGAEGRRALRNPFLHSHSVNCAIAGTNLSIDAHKAKSVTSVSAQTPRPRPNVLELYPNHNTSSNNIRRRFSRSSERSYDFEDFCYDLHGYATTSPTSSSKTRIFPKSSSKTSRTSPNPFLCRREQPSCPGRLGNIRRGLSLLSLCAGEVDADEDLDDHQQKKILRPPTRHFYQRGISGIPVKRPAKYMGLAF